MRETHAEKERERERATNTERHGDSEITSISFLIMLKLSNTAETTSMAVALPSLLL